jgi:hypothetical protein
MARKLDKTDIVSLNTIRPYHVSQSVDAFTGIEAYDISISGSFNVTGSTILSGSTYIPTLTQINQPSVVTVDTTTGQLFYTASNAFGSPLDTSSFFKQNGNSFGATAVLGTNDNYALRFETNSTTKMHIDTNGNVGINTTSPTGKLTVIGNNGFLSYDDTNAAGHLLQLSGSSTNLIRNNITVPSGSTQSTTVSYGIRGADEASFPGYGKQGDAFMYASNYANGLNLINFGDGLSGKEDYIRFYAGRDATQTPDIHIQGSGSTRGNVGVNITSPTSRMHINGTLANGEGNTTPGALSHAEGYFSTATGVYSHAEGYRATSSGQYSHAEGWGTNASGIASHAEGQNTIASNTYSHAEGFSTVSSGIGSHSEGYETTSSGFSSHTEGQSTYAEGAYSHAEGRYTRALGSGSHSEGWETTASNDYAHAEGRGTRAIGFGSHAEGLNNTSTGNYSHAEGENTNAVGVSSHTSGQGTTATGNYSRAEGLETTAVGYYSHAEGYLTVSSGSYSHASGVGTVASGSTGQTVVGRYNTHGDINSPFIVGNGTDNATRKDAFKVTFRSTIVVPPISVAPSWTGTDGEMVPAVVGGVYYLYIYFSAIGWRRTALT